VSSVAKHIIYISIILLLLAALVLTITISCKNHDADSRAMADARRTAKEIRQSLDIALEDAKRWKSMAEGNEKRAIELEERLRLIVAGFSQGEEIFGELVNQTHELIRTTGEFRRVLDQSARNNQAP